MTISATEPDWAREKHRWAWDPSRRLLGAIRAYQKGGAIRRRVAILRYRLWSTITGADIPLNTRIGGGLLLPHPNGVVIHPSTEIGVNCTIFQQVTLGVNRNQKGAPRIEGHVDIGPGARIIGPVKIGKHAVIGANAVVLSDVPAGSTAVGVPARIIKHKDPS
ncbi:serine acetyltransferase [Ruegeria sp. ANG-R]|uniref:serine O-acetyltransferase n=1 Tax=Ruegeria sp. ANG-R TaxID=1577903 RepID=UPI00057E59E3|nr:serine acetyltransferase [Ruegeria sp. ANG-R]KIC40591.1 serine acetyltransferase [Ruegeria sp. ANG-R]